MSQETHDINTLLELQQVAVKMGKSFEPGDVIYLIGDLGAGKTTFCQYLLQACGVTETVKSPTYTLYETYQGDDHKYVHMDLYRLTDPEELFFLGIEELVNGDNILLVEWPDKGRGVMPEANWILAFSMQNLNRTLTITSK